MKKTGVLLVMIAMLALTAGQARAVALGGYMEFSGGSGEGEYDNSPSFDVDAAAFNFGFVLDTMVTNEKLFNYRLNVGFERLDLEDDNNITRELGGLVIDNTFGFRLMEQASWRLWIGPQIRVGFYGGNTDTTPEIDLYLTGFALGAVLGANFFPSEHLVISVTGGIRFSGYAGEEDWLLVDRDVSFGTTTGFLNLSLMYN